MNINLYNYTHSVVLDCESATTIITTLTNSNGYTPTQHHIYHGYIHLHIHIQDTSIYLSMHTMKLWIVNQQQLQPLLW